MQAGPAPAVKVLPCEPGNVFRQKYLRVGGIFYAVGFGYSW